MLKIIVPCEQMNTSMTDWQKAKYIVLIVVLLSLSYAIVRYNLVREVALSNIPLYITNKAVAMAAVLLIGLSFALGPLAHYFPARFGPHAGLRKPLGIFGFGIAFVHLLMSLPLFSKFYLPKLYVVDGRLNVIGELSMLFGISAFVILAVVALFSLPELGERLEKSRWKTIQRMGYAALALVLLHVAVFGFPGWFTIEAWRYGLLPITLIVTLFILVVIGLRLSVIRRN